MEEKSTRTILINNLRFVVIDVGFVSMPDVDGCLSVTVVCTLVVLPSVAAVVCVVGIVLATSVGTILVKSSLALRRKIEFFSRASL